MLESVFKVIDFHNYDSQKLSQGINTEVVNKIKTELWSACSEQGFFYIKNHGINQRIIEEMFTLGKSFFSLTFEEKNPFKGENNVGYSQPGKERLSETLVDFKESFNFKRDVSTMKDLPPLFENKKQVIQNFLEKTWDLTRTILVGISFSLDLEPDYFNEAHNFEEKSGSIFRLLHYPPLEEKMNCDNTIRAGSHSDYGTITLLFQETPSKEKELASGLQVLMRDTDENGNPKWKDVPSKEECIVVNVADLLSFWTEGRLRSAIHKVIIPEGENASKSRYSMAYFVHPDSSFPIHPIPSKLPAPFPAQKSESGVLKASFGESEFFYGESGDLYLKRRLDSTYR